MAIKKKSKLPPLPNSRLLGAILLLVAGSLFVYNSYFTRYSKKPEEIKRVPYSTFLQQVNKGEVQEVLVGNQEITYTLKNQSAEPGGQWATVRVPDLRLPAQLEARGAIFSAPSPANNTWFAILLNWVIPPLILVAAFQFFLRNDSKG